MKLSELPVGTRLREPGSGLVFLVAAHHHPGYRGTILVTDRIVRKGCFDAREPGEPRNKIEKYGCNDYAFSNIHQWLNREEADWFRPEHPLDAPPAEGDVSVPAGAYAGAPGFLARFPRAFREALLENDIPCARIWDGVEMPVTVPGKFFLLSADELGLRQFTGVAEGSLMPLFQDFRMRLGIKEADPADFNFPGEVSENNREMGWYYWLRTPHHVYPFLSAHVHFSGYISYLQCWNGDLGIRPACALAPETPVNPEPDGDMIYDLMLGGAEA